MSSASACYENSEAETVAGLLSAVAVIIGLMCTLSNLFDSEQKARRVFPGRLVTILGVIITTLEGTICMGWFVDWKQLSYRFDDDNDDDENGLGDDVDENERHMSLCLVQGFLFQTCLMGMVCYSFWLCLTFYHVIGSRHRHNLFLESVKRNWRVEMAVHGFIALFCLSLAGGAVAGNLISGSSGAPSCWIERMDYQLYFFYIAMVLALGAGIVFSVKATSELCRIQQGGGAPGSSMANPPDQPTEARPLALRRVVWGNVAWTASV